MQPKLDKKFVLEIIKKLEKKYKGLEETKEYENALFIICSELVKMELCRAGKIMPSSLSCADGNMP